jgi:nitrogen-specific signal transduction histidine kinase
VRKGLAQMIGDAERASSVVNRIRALARKDPSDHRLLDLNAVINDVVRLVAREIAAHRA